MSAVLGWHFIRGDMRLGYGDGREVKIGKWVSVDGPPILGEHGLHASRRAIDALTSLGWEGAVICRVELGGKIVHGDNMMVAQRRRVLWAAQAEGALRYFALGCGTKALQEHYPDAPESLWHAMDLRSAIEEGLEVDLDTRYAAWAVARDAAWDAVWDAVWDAAWDAARVAAYAAGDATRAAAWYAARIAAWNAVDAAKTAAIDAKNRHLERLISALPRTRLAKARGEQ